jgi:DNA-binding NtrC family response regulator
MKPQPFLRRVVLAGIPPADLELWSGWLRDAGHEVEAWPGLEAAATAAPWALAIIDDRGGFDGPAAVAELKRLCPEAGVLLSLAKGQVAAAVRGMKAGASGCLPRPLGRERLLAAVHAQCDAVDLQAQVDRLRAELLRQRSLTGILGASPALQKCLELAKMVAAYPVNVLVSGETGTGKEAIAKIVHQGSGRREGPFVAVDCGAIVPELADDEFFGHTRGAFTGADAERDGCLERSSGGTLFLDEIGNLPAGLQAKLLRVLQTGELWRLGGQAPRAVDLRVVAATHEDLPRLIEKGLFRLDLYHRLNEFELRLPPLRERGAEDIDVLAAHFLQAFGQRFSKPGLELSGEARRRLLEFPWPGNIRQLENAMKHAVVMAAGTVELAQLPAEIRDWQPPATASSQPQAGETPDSSLNLWEAERRVTEMVERAMMSEALLRNRWDKKLAALELGLHVKTLARKLKAYGMTAPVERA